MSGFLDDLADYDPDESAESRERRCIERAEKIIGRFDQFVRTHGVTHGEAAEAIVADPARFTMFIQRQWPSDWSDLSASLGDWINTREDELRRESMMPVMTPTILNVLGIVDNLKEDGGFGLVIGDSGLGKTEAIRAVALRNPKAIVFTPAEARLTAKAMLEDIGQRLHRSYFSRDTADTYRMVCKHLSASCDLLVIDQAHALVGYPKLFNILADLLRETGVPQLWVATGDLRRYLDNKVGSWRDPFAQIRSRITHQLDLNVVRDRGDAIDDAGVRELAKRKFNLKLDAGAVMDLQAVAGLDNEGGIRLLENVLKHVRRVAIDAKLNTINRQTVRASMDRTLSKRTRERLAQQRRANEPSDYRPAVPAVVVEKRSKVG